MNMKVPIMTTTRICRRYCMKAVSAPTWTSSASATVTAEPQHGGGGQMQDHGDDWAHEDEESAMRTEVSVRMALASVKRLVS